MNDHFENYTVRDLTVFYQHVTYIVNEPRTSMRRITMISLAYSRLEITNLTLPMATDNVNHDPRLIMHAKLRSRTPYILRCCRSQLEETRTCAGAGGELRNIRPRLEV